MKKDLLIVTAIIALLGAYVYAAAGYQPHSLGWVTLSLSSGTVTQINNSTAPTVGYMKWCYNCVANGGAGTICISTGSTNANQFVLSTGTACK
jgi:hypothetical protein